MFNTYWNWQRVTAAIALRILLITFLFTLMAFAVGLFLGIVILALQSTFTGAIEFSRAYRHFAIPAGFVGMFAGFTGMLVIELRHLRRPRGRISAPKSLPF
jgi:hypothetical protein